MAGPSISLRCWSRQRGISSPRRGTAMLRAALNTCRETGWLMYFPELLGVLAEGLGGLGRTAEALVTLGQALAKAEKRGERWCVPELHRLNGELVLQEVETDPRSKPRQVSVDRSKRRASRTPCSGNCGPRSVSPASGFGKTGILMQGWYWSWASTGLRKGSRRRTLWLPGRCSHRCSEGIAGARQRSSFGKSGC